RQIVAHLDQRANRPVEHLGGDPRRRLVGPHVAVDGGHLGGDALREPYLELAKPGKTERMTEPRDGRLADARARGDFRHGQVEHLARRLDYVIRELALGRAQLLAHLCDLGQHHRETRTMLKDAWTIADCTKRYKNYILRSRCNPWFRRSAAERQPVRRCARRCDAAAQQETSLRRCSFSTNMASSVEPTPPRHLPGKAPCA